MTAMSVEQAGVRELTLEEIEQVGGAIDACTAMGIGGVVAGAIGFGFSVAAAPATGGASLGLWAAAVGFGGAGIGMGAAGAACTVAS